ncbi:hypothetical protein NCC49_003241 [Naganishia albida]|nr:hypothetical protein NCC49_003241 [Naganishia albida]
MQWPLLYSISTDTVILRLPPHQVDQILTVLVGNAPFYVEKQFIERICLMRCIHRENGGTFGKRFTRDLRIGRSPTSLTIRFGDGRPPTWSLGHSEQTIVSSADSSLSDSSPSGSSTSPPSVVTPTPCWEQI